jgi:hypothetical protein
MLTEDSHVNCAQSTVTAQSREVNRAPLQNMDEYVLLNEESNEARRSKCASQAKGRSRDGVADM